MYPYIYPQGRGSHKGEGPAAQSRGRGSPERRGAKLGTGALGGSAALRVAKLGVGAAAPSWERFGIGIAFNYFGIVLGSLWGY